MEKKNMILLTVIAVSTLLVAVVGATFAYFTATTTSQGNNTTTTVKTQQIAGTDWTATAKKGASPAVYPGYMAYQEYLLDASSGTTGSKAKYNLSIQGTTDTAFGEDVTYEVYAVTQSAAPTYTFTAGTSSQVQVPGGNEYHYSIADAAFDNGTELKLVKSGTLTATKTAIESDVTIDGGSKRYYVLVLKYANQEKPQDTQQAKTFTAQLIYEPQTIS